MDPAPILDVRQVAAILGKPPGFARKAMREMECVMDLDGRGRELRVFRTALDNWLKSRRLPGVWRNDNTFTQEVHWMVHLHLSRLNGELSFKTGHWPMNENREAQGHAHPLKSGMSDRGCIDAPRTVDPIGAGTRPAPTK